MNLSFKKQGKQSHKYGVLLAILLLVSYVLGACGDSATTAPATTTRAATATTNAPATAAVTSAATTSGSAATTTANAPTTAGATKPPIVPITIATPTEALKGIEKVEQDTAKVRGLDFKTKVDVNFMTRDDMGKYMAESFTRDNPVEKIADYQKTLVAFGFVKPDFDYIKINNKLTEGAVLGFYDSDTKKLYIVLEDAQKPVGPLAKFTVEHELTHALQDQYFDLGKVRELRKPEAIQGNDDRDLAVLGLVEGDAVQSQYSWLQGRYLSQAELSQLLKENQDAVSNLDLSDVPAIMLDTLYFPYQQGLTFVQQLYKQGGWEAVNKGYTEYVPVSTSQILHFEKYQKKIEPVKVELTEMTAVLGSGWRSLDINTMGEFATGIWLKGQIPEADATKTAEGWGGDRYQVLEKDGKTGFVWRTAWDNATESTEFFNQSLKYMVPTYNLQGNGGNGQKRSWQTTDFDVQLIQKDKEVLVIYLPKGDAAGKVISKLGF